MPRTTPPSGSLIKKTLEFTREARSGARRALGLKPKPKAIFTIEGHLRDPQAMEALLAISDRMMDEHREHVMQDFRKDGLSPLTRYVIYMAFLETVSQPVRPLARYIRKSPSGCLRCPTRWIAIIPPIRAGNAATATPGPLK